MSAAAGWQLTGFAVTAVLIYPTGTFPGVRMKSAAGGSWYFTVTGVQRAWQSAGTSGEEVMMQWI